jgi:Helix-turn-helix domain
MTTKGGEQFDWNALVPHVIHPLKVAIIEALEWVEQPLSATDFRKLLNERFSTPRISYHLVKLAEADAVELTRQQQVRGMTEKFYFFPPVK